MKRTFLTFAVFSIVSQFVTAQTNPFPTNGGADQLNGFGASSSTQSVDIRHNNQYPFVFNWHTGLTFSAHSAYGGIRFYNQDYPNPYGANSKIVMSITDGNVGIGVTNPQHKLDVNGTIHAKEVKVDLSGWADFVFKKGYDLPSLEEVEKHIQQKGHLPGIPSEKEVLENGISLAENQTLLLQKIEELTLYSIEQSKKLKLQAEEISYQTGAIKEQSKMIKTLEQKNSSLKSLIERVEKLEQSFVE